MRIRPFALSGGAVVVAATLAVVTSATASAATTSEKPTARKHPVAALSVSTTKPAVGAKVVANASHSRLPKGDRLRKAKVAFGDGSRAVTLHSLKARARHAYAKPGTFRVVLTIVDRHGVKVTRSKRVTVHAKQVPPASSGLPIRIPAGASSKTPISSLGLSATTLSKVSSLVGIPVGTLPVLPVGFLHLLPAADLTGAALPSLPGLAGVPGAGDLVSLLSGGLGGLPFALPINIGLTRTQLIGTVPSSVLSSVQLTSLSTLFGIPTSVVSGLPLGVLRLLPGNLVQYVTSGGTPPPPSTGLPLSLPSGLSPNSLISSLGLSSTALSSVSSLVGIPVGTLTGLPVGFLGLLPSGDLTGAGLPSLPGLAGVPVVGDLVSLLSGGLGGLPFSLPTNIGLTGSQLIGTVPSSVLSSVQLTSLSTLFGIPTSVLSGLPLGIVSLLPGNLVQYVTSGGTPPPPPVPMLPLNLPAGLSPSSLISSLGLSSTALSSVSSLVGIPVGTLTGLPVGFLGLLPSGDLTGAGLPSLPGLASLPLVGNLLGMLLAGLPITIPSGVLPTTLISALPSGTLSALQLGTLSTYFGVGTSVLGTLPVNVLTLMPTGLLSGL